MKKTFLVKRNGLLSLTDVSWGVFALACAIIVLLVRLIAPGFFWYVFTPVFRVADAVSLEGHSFISGFENAAKLTAQNERLANENTALANENQALAQKIIDIEDLFTSTTAKSGILAGVVARPPESPYDTLVLAAGENAGITLGMEAFGDGGVPLGIVSSVLADFSRVTLFSAPGVTTAGWVGNDGLAITISGAGAGVMNATVSRSAAIAVGDTVFAPGPGMLPIGKVIRIDSNPTAPGVTLRIQPALNLFSVSWVTIRDTGVPFSISATSTP
ncbi:MAG: rod shape-determining protein MreC [Candidatus Paceibacterota bacterium]|jgi:cell shape-determining protein MreC